MNEHSGKEGLQHVAEEAKHLAHVVDGKASQFERSIGLISNFSLGFTYLSPLTAVYSLFALRLLWRGRLRFGGW